jgi:tRNA 2-thiouridine synthesizing protein A
MTHHDMTDHELDAAGLLCPLPVLKARKRLEGLKSGEILRLIATDPASVIDVPHFCTEQGHELLSQEASDGRHIFRIRHK